MRLTYQFMEILFWRNKMLVEKGYFLLNLCRMASLWHQDKYLVNPTMDKYETVEDLVQDIYNACEYALYPRNKIYFSKRELEIISHFKSFMDKNFGIDFWNEIEKIDNKTLVYSNKTWIKAREFAGAIIKRFGFRIENFNYENF